MNSICAESPAGGQGQGNPSRRSPDYRTPRPRVNANPEMVQGEQHHGEPRPSTDGAELGLLVLALQRRDLPKMARRHGYGLVETWLRQLVATRHPEAA